MAAFNFPNNPSVNDVYGQNNVFWKWNGTVWYPLGNSAGVGSDPVWDVKGDIAVATGNTNAIVLPVGSNERETLSTDSSTNTGLKWNGLSNLESHFSRWLIGYYTVTTTSTTPASVNLSSTTSFGTATSIEASATRQRSLRFVSAASTSSDSGFASNGATGHMLHDIKFITICEFNTLTNVRATVGFGSGTSNIKSYDLSTFAHGAAWFRYSTSAGDTNWKCITAKYSDNTKKVTDSGVAVTASQTKFEIHKTATEVKFFINNNLVATHTTHIPDENSGLFVLLNAQNLTAASSTVYFNQMALMTRIPYS